MLSRAAAEFEFIIPALPMFLLSESSDFCTFFGKFYQQPWPRICISSSLSSVSLKRWRTGVLDRLYWVFGGRVGSRILKCRRGFQGWGFLPTLIITCLLLFRDSCTRSKYCFLMLLPILVLGIEDRNLSIDGCVLIFSNLFSPSFSCAYSVRICCRKFFMSVCRCASSFCFLCFS